MAATNVMFPTVKIERQTLETTLTQLDALAAQMATAQKFGQPLLHDTTTSWAGRIQSLTNVIRSNISPAL